MSGKSDVTQNGTSQRFVQGSTLYKVQICTRYNIYKVCTSFVEKKSARNYYEKKSARILREKVYENMEFPYSCWVSL